MKTISLTLNDLDFIINPLHTACMDRKPAMVDNTTGISSKGSRKSHHRSYLALPGYRAPKLKKVLGRFWVSILPELLQIILEDVNRCYSLVKFKKRS